MRRLHLAGYMRVVIGDDVERMTIFLSCGICTLWVLAEEAVRHHAVPSVQTPFWAI